MRKVINVLLLLALGALFFSCSATKPVLKKAKIIPTDRIIKRIEANRRKVKTFYGSGVIKLESDNFSVKGNFEVYIKKPDSIKIAVFGPFGLEVGELLVTDNGYLFYDAMRNVLYSSKEKSKVLSKIFKVDFNFGDVLDAFAGAVNMSDKLNSLPKIAEESEESYYFTYGSDKRKSVYEINKDDLSINGYSLFEGKSKLLTSKYYDFAKINGIIIPYKIDLKYFGDNSSLKIDYRNIEVNKRIPDLALKVPKDANKLSL